MTRRFETVAAVAIAVALGGCGSGSESSSPAAATEAASADVAPGTPGYAPRFEVDPLWPKPLPNNWLLGSTIGLSVDSRDHVWILHRPGSLNARTEASAGENTPTGACCSAAPPVVELDAEGNVVSS